MSDGNKFDKYYDFRIATVNDIDMIMQFIDMYWKKDHIMAKDRRLFEYQHLYGKKVTFILAFSKETSELEAILGYIPTSNNKQKNDVWTAIWKVRDDHDNVPMLGLELIKRLEKLENCRNIIIVGANPETAVPVMKIIMKYYTGRMKHYYRLGNYNEFKIAVNVENEKQLTDIYSTNISWKRIDEKEFTDVYEILELNGANQEIPYKDKEYYIKRYYKHPYYKYQIYKLVNAKYTSLVILKEVEIQERKIARIIDYVGNQICFSKAGYFFTELINNNAYEYIDFYCLNFNDQFITDAGFVERNESDSIIIPNYMEPFVQQNVEIYTCYKNENCIIFKGDADQDRPNIIKK